MKLTAQRNDLLSSLSTAGKALGKTIVPILENFRIQIIKGKCYITGCNMENFVTKRLEIVSEIQSLDVCVAATELLQLVKGLADQPLYFEFFVNTLVITWSTGDCELPTESGEHYPKTPKVDNDFSHFLEAGVLIDGIEKTLFAINPNISKAGFPYALFSFGNGIIIVGCDTRIMAVTRIFENTINLKQALLTKTSLEVLKAIK